MIRGICVKKISSILILAAMLIVSSVSAGATLNPTGPTTEAATNTTYFEEWSAEGRVESFLDGNYAFAKDGQFAWADDEKQDMGEAAYVENDEMYIPSEFANTVFEGDYAEEFVSLSDIAADTGLSLFFDPIGFAMLSENENAVNTQVSNATIGYKDYYTVSDAIGFLTWDDVTENEFTQDDRSEYIARWQGLLTVPSDYEGDAVNTWKNNLSRQYNSIHRKLNLDGERGGVPFTDADLSQFPDDKWTRSSGAYTSVITECYDNLFVMAKYYRYYEPDNDELRDEIIDVLDYLLENHYSKEIDRYNKTSGNDYTPRGSWTVYQLTIPFSYSNILCLMADDMSQREMQEHTDAIFDRTIDPTVKNAGVTYEYTANRMWRTLGYFNTAVLAGDYERMNYAMRYINQVFSLYPEKSTLTYPTDGFYEDGSMIFHGYIPYNLGYGDSFYVTLSEMITLTEDTAFSVEKVHNFENIYTFLKKSFLPFYTDNIEMHMVVGRSKALNTGLSMIRSALIIAGTADEETQTDLIGEIKKSFYNYLDGYENYDESTSTDDDYVFSAAARDITFWKNREELWNKAEALPPEELCDVYYNMDRAQWRNDEYTAALSMSSERVMKYEAQGTQNLRGWYTGDGMLYLYTGDQKQYTRNYFDKVNALFMPGTTVDETKRTEENTKNGMMSDKSWAGGATDGINAVCGYELSTAPLADVPQGISIEGRKSYFLLNGKVVCIGSGITGGEGEVCTVVDNRLIDIEGTE